MQNPELHNDGDLSFNDNVICIYSWKLDCDTSLSAESNPDSSKRNRTRQNPQYY